MRGYERLTDIVSLVSGNVGGSHHGRNTCSALIKTLYKVTMQDLKHFLTHKDPVTGKLPQIGGSADKMTDLASVQWLAICL